MILWLNHRLNEDLKYVKCFSKFESGLGFLERTCGGGRNHQAEKLRARTQKLKDMQ